MSKKKVTMQMIADELGITKVTVSRALSGSDGVSEDLREKIKSTAQSLGYGVQPQVPQSNQRIIGVVVPEVFLEKDENFYTRLYKNLYVALDDQECLCILNVISKDDEVQGILPKLCSNQLVTGIIVLGQLERSYIEVLEKAGLPLILVDFYYRGIEIDSVITDNVYAMYEVTNYLIDKGHQSIGFIGNVNLTSSIQDRYLGYCKAMMENGLKINSNVVIDDRDSLGDSVEIELPAKLPTAFVCNSDQAARRLIELLQSKQINVPEDVSVMGFDDVWHSLMVNPQITTVKVQRKEMAEFTVSRLLEQINSNEELVTRRIVVPTKIVERNSVKRIKM